MADETKKPLEPRLLELTALWPRTDAQGRKLPGLQGRLGNVRILILRNDNRRDGKNDPAYRVFLAPSQPKADTRDAEDEEVLP